MTVAAREKDVELEARHARAKRLAAQRRAAQVQLLPEQFVLRHPEAKYVDV